MREVPRSTSSFGFLTGHELEGRRFGAAFVALERLLVDRTRNHDPHGSATLVALSEALLEADALILAFKLGVEELDALFRHLLVAQISSRRGRGLTLRDTATATLDQPLRWKGRPREAVGGFELYDMRARQWAPELGTFLSIDEYAFHDASSNLWGWPGQNPARYADPSGRNPAVIVALAAATILGMGAAAPSDTSAMPSDVLGMVASVPGLGPATIGALKYFVGSLLERLSPTLAKLLANGTRAASEAQCPAAARGGGGLVDDAVGASTPVGRRGAPLTVPPGTNAPATIGGRNFTGHALDQMQSRGFTPTVVENTIQQGARPPGNQAGTFQHVFEEVRVITNEAGGVITVIPR